MLQYTTHRPPSLHLLQYIINNGGIAAEASYPYTAEDGTCDRSKQKQTVVSIDAVETVPPSNETALMQGVSMHPIGVAVCVGDYIQEWRAYTGGVLHLPSMTHTMRPAMRCC